MSLGHSAAAMTVSEDVYLTHCSFARGHHSQKVYDSGSGSLSPTIRSKSLLLSSRFLPASSICATPTPIHQNLPAHSKGLTA